MKKNKLRKYLPLLLLISSTFAVQGQDFDCQLVFWESIRDTVDAYGDPAVLIRMNTIDNPNNTGYTSFHLVDELSNTVVEKTGPHYFLPAVEAVGNPIMEYVLTLKPPFVSIEEDFKGRLLTEFPICAFRLERSVSTEEVFSVQPEEIKVYPNPFGSSIHFHSSALQDAELIIYNAWGVQLANPKLIQDQILSLDTEAWPSGIYFLKMEKGITKFVKL